MVSGMSRFLGKVHEGWPTFSWISKKRIKDCMLKPFIQTAEIQLFTKFRNIKLFSSAFDENFISVGLEDMSYVNMYGISLETQL